mgnify:CR=1 FL=1
MKTASDIIVPVVTVTIGIGLIVLMLVGMVRSLDASAKRQKKEYQECKEKTMDIEWCYKTVYNINVSK